MKRPYTLIVPAAIGEVLHDGTRREHAMRIECAVLAEDVADAARIVAQAVHVALVRGCHSPAEEEVRADLLALPLRATTTEQRAAFAVVQAPRRGLREAIEG